MSRVLPILFNTEMVRAVLNGKTVTRRAVKYKYSNTEIKIKSDKYGSRLIEIQKDIEGETYGVRPDGSTWRKLLGYIDKKSPYRPGDILYVRETWKVHYLNPSFCMMIRYKVDNFCNQQVKFSPSRYEKFQKYNEKDGWQSPYFMPKEAARIWLKVKDVRVERLQDMTLDDFLQEGVAIKPEAYNDPENAYRQAMSEYIRIWNSTIKKSDMEKYGWDANPWVWIIEFERCEKPEREV